ncbi:hypothetical protein PN836_016655 [Ningiella sp. W23]|uniref:hypothetical protein n=1 Tax=Ningiella sp. W23 TaxID=3023715 RepID=UPI0037571480
MIEFVDTINAPSLVKNYCIAHTKPVIPFCESTFNLEIGAEGTLNSRDFENTINCFNLIPFGKRFRRELGSSLGSFAARKHLLASNDNLDFAINISTYRTFMLSNKRPKHFHKVLKLNFITERESEVLADLALPSEVSCAWKLPMPISVGTIERNYAYCHHIEDLDLHLEIAISEGILTTAESDELRNTKILLPGALSVGMMPAQIFCDINEKLEVISRKFLDVFWAEQRDDYQIRAANFCHERLGSYLLEQHLRKTYGGLVSSHFGYWTRVDNDLSYSQGKMTT